MRPVVFGVLLAGCVTDGDAGGDAARDAAPVDAAPADVERLLPPDMYVEDGCDCIHVSDGRIPRPECDQVGRPDLADAIDGRDPRARTYAETAGDYEVVCPGMLALGAECVGDDECSSGLCISIDGAPPFCARLCVDTCPTGYECRGLGERDYCVPM